MIQFLKKYSKRRARWTIVLPAQKMNCSCCRQEEISRRRKSMKGLIWNVSRTIMRICKHICFQVASRSQQKTFLAHLGNSSRKIELFPKSNIFVANIEKIQTWDRIVLVESALLVTVFATKYGGDREPLSHYNRNYFRRDKGRRKRQT